MTTRTALEDLTQDRLTKIVREHYTGEAAELMCSMVKELPRMNQLWNVRTAKAKLPQVLELVRKNAPQFVLREGDEEPVILISMRAMHNLLERGIVEQSFTERMAPFMQHTSTTLAVPELGEMDHFTIPVVSEQELARS